MGEKEFIIYTSQMFPSPTIAKILDDIKTYKPKKLLFFNPSECTFLGTENRSEFDELKILLEKYDIIFYVLIGSETINGGKDILVGKNIEYLFWPTYLIHYTYPPIETQLNNLKYKKIETLFSYYNRRPKKHRGLFLEKLFINNLFEFGNISWHLLTEENFADTHYQFEFWKEIQLIPNTEDDGDSYKIKFFDDNSLFHIVGETETNKNFITEKTYRTIFIEKPFIIFGSKNANLCLKKYGFDVYEELINYEFDEKEKIEERLDGIIHELIKLKKENLPNLFESIEHKVKHNKNRILEIVKKDEYIPKKLVELYYEYKTEFNEVINKNYIGNYVKKIIENYG
jgi:hypothetical protein